MGLLDTVAAMFRCAPEETADTRRKRIIGEYINACAEYGSRTMADIKLLPHPKEEIQEAMLWFMENNPKSRQTLSSIFLGTAIYQHKVSSRDATELLDSVAAEYENLRLRMQRRGIS